MILVRRHHVGLAVKGTACGAEDHLPDPMVDAGFQNIDASDDVHLRVECRVGDGFRHLGLGGMVVDDLGAECSDGLLDLRLLAKVYPMHLCRSVDVALAAGAEVVQDSDLVPGRDVRVNDVGADESRTPSHHNPHGRDSSGFT